MINKDAYPEHRYDECLYCHFGGLFGVSVSILSNIIPFSIMTSALDFSAQRLSRQQHTT